MTTQRCGNTLPLDRGRRLPGERGTPKWRRKPPTTRAGSILRREDRVTLDEVVKINSGVVCHNHCTSLSNMAGWLAATADLPQDSWRVAAQARTSESFHFEPELLQQRATYRRTAL